MAKTKEIQNLLMVVVDALRPDFLGCYGFPLYDISPAINDISGHSVLFTNATADGRTVYSASRLMTANATFEASERNITLNVKCLPMHLQEHGVNCHIVTSNPLAASVFRAGGCKHITNVHPRDEIENGLLTETAIDIINNALEPWFIVVWYLIVHDYMLTCPITNKWCENIVTNSTWIFPCDERDVRLFQYAHSVARVDQQIAMLRTGINYNFQDFAFILTSDHGEKLGEQHTLHKDVHYTHVYSQAYDLSRVPLIIRPATHKYKYSSMMCAKVINWINLPPTICDLMGIKHDWNSKSFVDELYLPPNDLKQHLKDLGYI